MSEYRHEFKYMIDAADEALIMAKAGTVLQRDPYVGDAGTYTVRSLYFDDVDNSCLYENLGGTDLRSKFRIRYYNNDTSVLKLEKKSKVHGMTHKDSCSITENEFLLLYAGRGLEIRANGPKQKLITEFFIKGMKPRVIVTYERVPFVFSGGNVRVTFDRKLTASDQVDRFLETDYRKRSVFELGKSILEVKFDEFLPVYINETLQTGKLKWTTFSKYYMCCMHGV